MKFLSYLLSGISLGSIYAIIALGYTMVYGIAKMLNFAHGDIIMVGGYVAFTAMSALNLPASVAVLLSVLFCTALGVIIEGVAYKPLRGANSLAVLITAIGVSYLLQNLALLIFGANPKSFRSVVPIQSMSFANGQLVISGETVAAIAACFLVMVALTTFINKTRAGQAMLAVAEDKGAATLMGINVNATVALTFAIGSALAALAGNHVLGLPDADADHRRDARHQGLCRRGPRRNRFHSRRADRRTAARCAREPLEGLYLLQTLGCHCFLGAYLGSGGAAHRHTREKDEREGVI